MTHTNFYKTKEEGRKITKDPLRVGIIFSASATFLLCFLFSFSLVSASNTPFGYDYLQHPTSSIINGSNYSINVNNSNYLEGHPASYFYPNNNPNGYFNITTLPADDDSQYLFLNGTRSMTGDLYLDGNSIWNVNTINLDTIESPTTAGIKITGGEQIQWYGLDREQYGLYQGLYPRGSEWGRVGFWGFLGGNYPDLAFQVSEEGGLIQFDPWNVNPITFGGVELRNINPSTTLPTAKSYFDDGAIFGDWIYDENEGYYDINNYLKITPSGSLQQTGTQEENILNKTKFTGNVNMTTNTTFQGLVQLKRQTLPTCGATTNGTIMTNSTKLYFCNGAIWNALY